MHLFEMAPTGRKKKLENARLQQKWLLQAGDFSKILKIGQLSFHCYSSYLTYIALLL